jgi:imidazoleglycerol phosphate dehydratase HisB
VATGATRIDALESSDLADYIFDHFEAPSLNFIDGKPTQKTIDTPNDFVSHMLEHIAWRLGVGIDIGWRSTDWRALGTFIGAHIHSLNIEKTSSATLGMIDDGAAECLVDFTKPAELKLSAHHSLNLDAILNMRVEQVQHGIELVELLGGLADGLDALIDIRICTFEDPHHSWEGVYRALGICLNRMRVSA